MELNSFLTGIADAIRSKKGTNDKINASNFASEIEKIQTGIEPSGTLDITENGEHNVREYEKVNVNVESSGGNTLKNLLDNTKSCYYLFTDYQNDNLNELISYNDTENVTIFSNMFYGCSSATSFPQLDTSKGTRFNVMYKGCSSATSFPQLDTSNATSLFGMYKDCHKIKLIDISKYNISSTSNSDSWCYNCYSLKALIIRSFGSSYTLNSNAFNYCYHILGTTNATYNPNGDKDGYIYVPRDMIETLSSATNWSTYATQFRALEDYTKDGTTTGEFDDEKAGLV